jgi:CRP-like cAMP-binding protein
MHMPPPNQIAAKNRLLTAIPQEDSERFFSDLHPVTLSLRQVLCQVGAPLEDVYFIEEGVASVLTNMADGSTIEVGMIGMEGMVGRSAGAVLYFDNSSAVARSITNQVRGRKSVSAR